MEHEPTSGKRDPDRWYGHRYVGFVAMNMAVVGGLSYSVWRSIPPLRATPWDTVIPLNAIAVLAFAALYPILGRQRPGAARLASLYAAFVVTFAAYGAFLSLGSAIHRPLFVLARVRESIWLGHLFGLPTLVLCAAANALMSRVFFPRRAEIPLA